MTKSQSETRISDGNQVVVPAAIRKRHDLEPGDVLVWESTGRTIRVRPRKKVTLDDIVGLGASGGEDAVAAKRRRQRGRA